MSVILRRNGKLRLYCKGADNVIYERLKAGSGEIKAKTQEHLNVSKLWSFDIKISDIGFLNYAFLVLFLLNP